MKVIFLDFDGVLNSKAYFEARHEGRTFYTEDIDPTAVSLLDELVRRTGAHVVISSTWRIYNPITKLVDMLRALRFTGNVIGCTPDLSTGGRYSNDVERGHEIQRWLDIHPIGREVTSFVILDDYADMAHLADRLIQTHKDHGLQREHVERAVAMLGESS